MPERGGCRARCLRARGHSRDQHRRPPAGPFENHDADAWRAAWALLLESVLHLVRGVLPGMKERGWGRILTITSIAVKQPVEGLILSNTLRAAVTGFARTLANEVAASRGSP
jgi:3-oxoacyl-[acyl-carrier protein] reductase